MLFGGVQLSPRHRVVTTSEDLAAMVRAVSAHPEIGLDTEGEGLRYANGKRPIGYGVGFLDPNGGQPWAWYVPWGHHTTEPQMDRTAALRALQDVLAATRSVVGHNLKFDMLSLRSIGIEVPDHVEVHDTLIGAHLVREGRPLQLEKVVNEARCSPWGDALVAKDEVDRYLAGRAKAHRLPLKKDDKEANVWAYLSRFGHAEVPVALEGEYCCRDVAHALVLDRLQRPQARGEGKPWEARSAWLYDNEMTLIRALRDMEWEGQAVDQPYLLWLAEQLDRDLETREAHLTTLFGHPVRWRNDNALRSFLYDDLRLPVRMRTEKKLPSIERAALMSLRDVEPRLEYVAEFRARLKVRQTYTKSLAFEVGDDGRVHTSFRQAGTDTGRFSSDHPNLQNIPMRHKEMARLVRRAFVVDPGQARVYGDYSQVELRVLGWVTESPVLCGAYQSPAYDAYVAGQLTHEQYVAARALEPEVDAHGDVARKRLGARETDPDWKVRRRAAKIVNFGSAYGMGPSGLNTNPELLMPMDEAEAFLEQYHHGMPEIRGTQAALFGKMRASKPPMFVNWMGRTRTVPALTYSDKNLRAAAEREAFASLIQGSAAEFTRVSIVRLWRLRKAGRFPGRLTSQVHDELQADCDRADKRETAVILRREMEGLRGMFRTGAGVNVPIVCDLEASETNWAEKENYEP